MTNVLAIVLLAILLANASLGFGRDDTDDPNGTRSGMIVYTDHRTGCQYLGTILGGITSRLDKDGKPVCAKQEPKP